MRKRKLKDRISEYVGCIIKRNHNPNHFNLNLLSQATSIFPATVWKKILVKYHQGHEFPRTSCFTKTCLNHTTGILFVLNSTSESFVYKIINSQGKTENMNISPKWPYCEQKLNKSIHWLSDTMYRTVCPGGLVCNAH